MLSVLKLGCLHTHTRARAAGCERTHKSYVAINDRGSVLNNKNRGKWERELQRQGESVRGVLWVCVGGNENIVRHIFSFPFWSHLLCVSFLLGFRVTLAFYFTSPLSSNVVALCSSLPPLCVKVKTQTLL